MKLYVAYVDARALEILPFDPAVHCREVDDGFTFDHTMVEGQVDEIQIERRQFGWSELTRVARSGVLVSWSPTGDPADAILLARGRLTIPEGLFTATQTVTCTCAPAYIRTKLLGFARDNLDRKPIADFRFSDANPDDPESYLLGTSGSYRVDPATWTVSLVDDLIGGRIVDLTDHVLGDPEDGPGSFGLPVSVLRAKLEVSWTQESRGICDLATYPGLNTGITSYDPDFGSRIEECLTDPNVEGWTIAGATWSRRLLSTAAATPVTSERYRYRAKGKTEVYERKADALLDPQTGRMRYTYSWVEKKKGETDAARWAREEKGLPAPDTDEEEEKDTLGSEHRLGVIFQAYAYDIQSIRAQFEFAQERREVLTASLEVPMVEGLVVTDDTESTTDDEDADVIEMSVDDVFADAAAPTYAPGHWDEGDYVMRGEARFRCTETHESTAFGMVRPGTSTTYWEPAADNGGDRASLVAVLDTALGQTYRDHVFMRLRKEARRRLRARNITITVPWEHGIGVTTADSVRIDVPWDDVSDRSVVGKVVSVKRSWSGEAGPTVQIEIGVAFGAAQEAVDTDESESVWLQNGSVPVEIGIRANQLQSAFYSSAGMLIVNQAAAQRDMMNVIAMAGGDPAQAPVRHPTRLGFTLLPLEPQEEIVREMEWYGRLVVTPAGMDFGG